MPRILDIFENPKIKSVRAITKISRNIDIEELLDRVPHVKLISTSKKKVVRFELKRASYLLLFPSRYVEVHAPDPGGIHDVLVAFRNEISKRALI